ncbi:MAG: RibD family protein [Pseudomonadota bacterium]
MDFIRPLLALAPDFRKRNKRPFVTLSYAQSLDGCISARPGEPLALSGQRSLRLTHQLRASHDAILVGIGTVFSDNPRLNVRLVNGSDPKPVVVDSFLRIPLDCNILTETSREPIIFTGDGVDEDKLKMLRKRGVLVFQVSANKDGLLNLGQILAILGDLSINSLMVEGGARIITSFLRDKLPDFIVLTLAPILVGGLRAVSDLGESDPRHFLRLRNPGHRWLGKDLILWGNLMSNFEDQSEFPAAVGASRF